METGTANQPVTISADAILQPASDFNFLRSEAIKWIQKLAGSSWTDHNTHDPGITILDVLCYAITDISYRLDYDIKDLLATETGNAYESLYSPAQVLTINPVTVLDLRKILLDIDGVQNAWIEKQTENEAKMFFFQDENKIGFANENNKGQPLNAKGIYNILLNLKPDANYYEVVERLYANRNLCEGFGAIKKLSPQYLAVSGIAEIGQTDDLNKTAAAMLYRIDRFISATPRFYSLSEMLAKGKTIDEIFEGPALIHGFIEDEELNSIIARAELHASDVIREMMDEPGILRVNNIGIYINDNTGAAPVQNWILPLDTSMVPVLDVNEINGAWLGSKLNFRKNGVALTIDLEKVKSYFNDLKNADSNPILPVEGRDIVPAIPGYQPINNYYSIQNHFPKLYGLSEDGLPESAPLLRKAQAKQLKAYLLFFEQILANYFAQAAQLKDLFSFFNNNYSTYFFQSVQNTVPLADEILIEASDDRIPGYVESADVALKRKNRFLDHLIARFGESLEEYALHLQGAVQWLKQNPAADTDTNISVPEKLVRDKLKFLSAYPAISNNRGRAYNCNQQSWNTNNVSGLEERIAAKLGIENFNRRSFNANEEGFFMIEHILLRPVPEDNIAFAAYNATNTIESFEDAGDGYITCNAVGHGLLNGEQVLISQSAIYGNDAYRIRWLSLNQFQIQTGFKGAENNTAKWIRYTLTPNTGFLVFNQQTNSLQADVFSLQLTFIFPANIKRFRNPDFCNFVENTVWQETPIHLRANIFWADVSQVAVQLEKFYNNLEEVNQEGILNEAQQLNQSFVNAAARLALNKIIFRAHRNNLLDKLPVNAYTYPLADIPVVIPGSQAELVIQYNEPAVITLLYSQPGVVYSAYDETGVLLNKDINASAGNDGQLSITTTALTRDNYIVSIEAKNVISNLSIKLFQTISVRIGINTNLLVLPPEQDILYGENAVIEIQETQSGTTYQLFDKDEKNALSDIAESINGGDLKIATKDGLYEDALVSVKATNTHTGQSAFLTAKPAINVYANTNLQPSLENPATDYGGETAIVLNNTQQSVSYYLYFKDIDDDGVDKTILQSTQYGPLPGNGALIKLPVKNLMEDLTVNIVAKKTNSGLEQWLPDFFIPVKPDAKRPLSLANDSPQAGDAVIILIKNPQRGVMYQLRQVSSSGGNISYTNIGVPVYYHKNRGIGKARIETDFVVDSYTETFVALPAGIITETTTFNVLATKATTKLQAVMDNITVTINT